jgi:hypothetical protein
MTSFLDKRYASTKKLTARSIMIFAVQLQQNPALIAVDFKALRFVLFDPTDRPLEQFKACKDLLQKFVMDYYNYFGFFKEKPEDFKPEEVWEFDKAMCSHAGDGECAEVYLLMYLDCLTQQRPARNLEIVSDQQREELFLKFGFELAFGQLLT